MRRLARRLFTLCSAVSSRLRNAALPEQDKASDDEDADSGQIVSDLRRVGFDTGHRHDVDHYLYFPVIEAAQVVADALRRQGYGVEVTRAATGDQWLVLANHQIVPDAVDTDELRAGLAELAADHGGEYDGWEAGPVK